MRFVHKTKGLFLIIPDDLELFRLHFLGKNGLHGSGGYKECHRHECRAFIDTRKSLLVHKKIGNFIYVLLNNIHDILPYFDFF